MSTPDDDQSPQFKAYPIRWLILFISFFNAIVRCICQSCYGQMNDVLVKLLRVGSSQIDWLVIIQSFFYMTMAIPLSWMTIRVGFRRSIILMSAILTIGFSLILLGVRMDNGYYSILIGQVVNSFCVLIAWGLLPLVAAFWFPANEVAIAVAVQLVARGTGEAVGSIIPPLLVNVHQSRSEIRFGLTMMFIPLIVIAAVLSLISYAFVPEAPPLPPSIAQLKKQRIETKPEINLKESLIQLHNVVKMVVFVPQFYVVTLVSSILGPLLRCYTILLSSMLHKTFSGQSHLNKMSGFVLFGSWILFIISALVSGPVIIKTERYRAVMVFSALISSVSCTLICLGMHLKMLALVYIGVILLGVGCGTENTSMFELLVEVTYPLSPFLVCSLNAIVEGGFRLTYPIAGRALLTNFGSGAATDFLALFAIVGLLVIASFPMRFKRWEAENSPEMAPLL